MFLALCHKRLKFYLEVVLFIMLVVCFVLYLLILYVGHSFTEVRRLALLHTDFCLLQISFKLQVDVCNNYFIRHMLRKQKRNHQQQR